MAAIRHTLHRDVFRPNDERLVGLVHVTKTSKKKKTSFLCTAVTTEKPICVTIYQIKKSDKDVFKKRYAWTLRELKTVDGKDEMKDTSEFDLHFDKVYKWVASSVQERNAFIVCLWKLCCQHLPRHKPNFINFPQALLEESTLKSENELATQAMEPIEVDDYQALTEREEKDLEKLMAECEFAISDAEAFTEELSRDLSLLDGTNINVIMKSENQVQNLISIIQDAIDEAIVIENRLNGYNDIIKHVHNSIEKMEEKNLRIQIQNKNNVKLLEELDNIVNQLDFPHKYKVAILDGDLTNPVSVNECVAAAEALQQALKANIHPALLRMSAVQDQQKLLEKLKIKFSQRLSKHLNNLFIHLGNEFKDTLSIHTIALALPKHNFHDQLLPYSNLMLWLKNMDDNAYSQLSKVYTSSLSKRYEKEIRDFFENAKEIGRTGGSSQDLAARSSGKIKSVSLLGADKEQFGSELDISEWHIFDKLLETMLSELEPVCLDEQKFCVQFFHLLSDSNSQSPQSNQLTLGANIIQPTEEQKKEKQINEEVRRMMGELFLVLEPELQNFITYYDKVDSFYSMYLLVRLSQHVMSAQDTGSFLSMTFANALVQAKRNFDKFMLAQIKSIEETKVYKKSKCGILPFVSNFEKFAQQAETVFKNSDRRTDLDKWYSKLVHSMFDAIMRIAKEHQKTPQEVIMMENFHHLYSLLSQLKVIYLDNERKEAKQKYNEHLQAYVTQYFGRPLEKLNIFFEGVQSKVSQGVKEEEVGYQLAYSKQELRKVIKEYPGKEVKKGLESLCKKVEKHLCEEENLLQVVWHSMQDEFIRQYKYIEGLIERCYPGSMITLDFSISDILQFFSDIARSH